MPKYYVHVPWFATVTVEVTAKNKKEALKKGFEDAYPSLCHQCSREVDLDGGADFDRAEDVSLVDKARDQ